jgi:hypothetical protein
MTQLGHFAGIRRPEPRAAAVLNRAGRRFAGLRAGMAAALFVDFPNEAVSASALGSSGERASVLAATDPLPFMVETPLMIEVDCENSSSLEAQQPALAMWNG